VDSLIERARRETDQSVRVRLYGEVQQILANEVPAINLWYLDNVLVHTRRVRQVALNPSGNYDFLKTAEIVSQ
jgi:peptide/nickel transport system substrate-binding protein